LPVSCLLAGPLVFDLDDGQPEQLDDGVVAGEVRAGLGHLAQLVVQGLDAVGGVQQLAHRRAEGQERREPVPGVLTGLDGLRVLVAQRGSRSGRMAIHMAKPSGLCAKNSRSLTPRR